MMYRDPNAEPGVPPEPALADLCEVQASHHKEATRPEYAPGDALALPSAFSVRLLRQAAMLRLDGIRPAQGCEVALPITAVIEKEDGRLLNRVTIRAWGESFGARLEIMLSGERATVRLFAGAVGTEGEQTALPPDAQFTLDGIRSTDSIRDFVIAPLKCYYPFNFMGVTGQGSMYPCACPGWLNQYNSYGGIRESGVMKGAWNGAHIRDMRDSFYAGRYDRHCRTEICPVLNSPTPQAPPHPDIIEQINARAKVLTTGPQYVLHDIDDGCNLACRMCRGSKIIVNQEHVEAAMRELDEIVDLGQMEQFNTSSNGEPFIFKPFVERMKSDYFSSRGIRLGITTNLTRFSDELMEEIRHNHFERLSVSGDGCSKETYEFVRIGASWETFERNLKGLKRWRAEGVIRHMRWNWVILEPNIKELDRAVTMAHEIGFDQIVFITQNYAANIRNVFEECDFAKLDEAYDRLASVNAFDRADVDMHSAHVLRDRGYRTLSYVASMVETQVRRNQITDDKAKTIIAMAMDEMAAGRLRPGDPLGPHETQMLNQLGFRYPG